METRFENILLLYKNMNIIKICVKNAVVYTNGLKGKLPEFYLTGWGNWNASDLCIVLLVLSHSE